MNNLQKTLPFPAPFENSETNSAASPHSQICLLSEKIYAGSPDAHSQDDIFIPLGVSAWDLAKRIPEQLGDKEIGTILEPQSWNDSPKLLVVNFEPDTVICVNDLKTNIVALVSVGDIIRIGNGPAFEVAHFHKVRIGAPETKQIGSPCPICFDKFVATSRILTCPCGCSVHWEIEGEPPLECALAVDKCPKCQNTIQLNEGFHPEPEFIRK